MGKRSVSKWCGLLEDGFGFKSLLCFVFPLSDQSTSCKGYCFLILFVTIFLCVKLVLICHAGLLFVDRISNLEVKS